MGVEKTREELLNELRGLEKELTHIDPGIKAIISSGYTDDPVIGNYGDYGFIGAITKPYKANDLKDLLEKVIREEAR